MNSNSGIVMQLEKSYAVIMTNSGEFLKVKVDKQAPKLGEVYTAKPAKTIPFYKYASMAASMLLILFFGGASYAYYTPTASVVVEINPSMELKINRWNRIIKSIPLNKDGEQVLASLSLKNKAINEGLDLVVEEAKKENFINDNYIKSGKVIRVSIGNVKSNKVPDLTSFEEHAKKNNLTVKVKAVEAKEEKEAPLKEDIKTVPDKSKDTPIEEKKNLEEKNNNPSDADKKDENKDIKPKDNDNKSNGNSSNKEDKDKSKSTKVTSISSIISNLRNNKDKDKTETATDKEKNNKDANNDSTKENNKGKK